MSTRQNASKIGIASVTLRALFAAFTRLWISPFKGDKGASSYFKDVVYTMIRSQLGNLNLAQERIMAPLTTATYLAFAKKNGFAPDSITLADGTQAHWIGNRNAEKTIMYCHGGGYVMPATSGLMQYLTDMKDSLVAQGSDTAVVLLAYTLAPEASYPTQLKQGVELLRYLIETENRNPSNITLGGDSAGGNLTLSILSHLSHPHPSVPELSLPSKLHAAFLLSPWVSFNTHTPSYVTNAERDCFDGRPLSRWSSAFLNSSSPFAGDFYSEPCTAPPSWWQATAGVVGEVLIWGGGHEVFLDGIEEFATRFEKGFGGAGGRVTKIITEKAAHEEMIIERMLGYKNGSESSRAVEGWVKAKL
ncbi:alpha/beta hydrolase fold domain-containing protein [Lepidopterella palustris CBS 459.81]|uniref:Alpha/beta hydrolase fold domain-containing protein n=1 Tax=Lepidopterella palustris CBS 459.81 TaxID=1314670 RepID=A0A8E2JF98_9PEZI|nr:alpha/beta hydrolase fold domain-containing protein [Lepidopterella palustris CBS 459.81]